MKQVLVVDDTKNIRMLLTTCLELKGYTVVTANNGIEALALVEKEAFDLAFIDIKMPELSGTEVLRRIRAQGFSFPIIIMTAYATVKNAVECTKLDAVAYLQKPFTVERVNDVLASLQNEKEKEDTFKAYIEKAKALMEKKYDIEALNLLKKALSINPSDGEVYYLIGKVHENNHEQEEAEKYFSTARVFNYGNNMKV